MSPMPSRRRSTSTSYSTSFRETSHSQPPHNPHRSDNDRSRQSGAHPGDEWLQSICPLTLSSSASCVSPGFHRRPPGRIRAEAAASTARTSTRTAARATPTPALPSAAALARRLAGCAVAAVRTSRSGLTAVVRAATHESGLRIRRAGRTRTTADPAATTGIRQLHPITAPTATAAAVCPRYSGGTGRCTCLPTVTTLGRARHQHGPSRGALSNSCYSYLDAIRIRAL